MKSITVIFMFLILTFTFIFSQDFKIEVDNPAPRIGHKFSITLNTNFFEEYIKQNLPSELQIEHNSMFFEKTNNVFVVPEKTGDIKIGPFEFEFDGKKYKSDSIIITVLDSLELCEGTWIKLIPWDKKEILLIEQQIYSGIDSSNNSLSTREVDDTYLISPISEEEILEFYKKATYTHPIGLTGYTYIRQIFSIANKLQDPVKLKESNFTKLPDGFILPDNFIK